MSRGRLVNLFAGPGTGKSTTAAALFAECKYRGFNTEMIREYAKDAAWEGRGKKFFDAQSYIFGKQYFRTVSMINEVEFAITDSPLLMSTVYIPEDYRAPSLKQTVLEHHRSFENLNIFLVRNKPYNPKGRNQTEDEAKELDQKIQALLNSTGEPYTILHFGRENPNQIIELMRAQGWLT